MSFNPTYDVVIIGGGIHGAGVAQAAQAAGYRCALIEKTCWAAGTSSKSSKLIHGGLRYLETAQIQLVWHSLAERRQLLKLAPDLVRPLQFYIPVYPHTRRRPWQLRIGLTLYSLLAGFTPLARFRSLSASARKFLTGLQQRDLQAVFAYWDAQTDDAALTRAVVHSALSLGLQTFCPKCVETIGRDKSGYTLQLNDGTHLHSQVVINAAGPWCNSVLDTVIPPVTAHAMDCVKGSHIVVAKKIAMHAFYLEAADGRAVFVLPWGDHSMIGTTEHIFTGNPDSVDVSSEETDYLCATVRQYFPDAELNIIDCFAGLRVLPAAKENPFFRPRDCFFYSDPIAPGLITLYGGKLTSFRHTSARVVKQIRSLLGARKIVADTRRLVLEKVDLTP